MHEIKKKKKKNQRDNKTTHRKSQAYVYTFYGDLSYIFFFSIMLNNFNII